jgi:hypothetical protein
LTRTLALANFVAFAFAGEASFYRVLGGTIPLLPLIVPYPRYWLPEFFLLGATVTRGPFNHVHEARTLLLAMWVPLALPFVVVFGMDLVSNWKYLRERVEGLRRPGPG